METRFTKTLYLSVCTLAVQRLHLLSTIEFEQS